MTRAGRAISTPIRTERIIIGIDPGLASVGYGIVAESGGQLRHLAHGCIFYFGRQPLRTAT